MSKILLIDNFDSFTYNLFHYLEELYKGEVIVMRNDEIDFNTIDEFEAVVISPGPGLPKAAGELMKFLNDYSETKKILGVCLGMQAIAEHFSMQLKNLKEVVHGQSHTVFVGNSNKGIYENLPNQFKVGRYHSWVIDAATFNNKFEVTAKTENGEIMSIQHKSLPICAVQYHPESILTEYGKEIIRNWLS